MTAARSAHLAIMVVAVVAMAAGTAPAQSKNRRNDEPASISGFTREIEVLIDLAQALGDRDFVRYLQQHLRKDYAEEIAHVLEPADTRADFVKRIAALTSVDPVERDRALELILTQQLKRSTYADALETPARISTAAHRDNLREQIALTSYQKREPTVTVTAVDAVIASALADYWGPMTHQQSTESPSCEKSKPVPSAASSKRT